jgi:hypothetical protein
LTLATCNGGARIARGKWRHSHTHVLSSHPQSLVTMATPAAQPAKKFKLKPEENLALGVSAGVFTKLINYPLLNWKNSSQQGAVMRWSWTLVDVEMESWRGGGGEGGEGGGTGGGGGDGVGGCLWLWLW